jgi:hypothetical protein
MRNRSWAGGAFSSHQWGQWGANGNRSWGYSIHDTGSPRLAVYPAGTDASLIGPTALEPFTYEDNEDAWVAAFVELDIGGGNRRFSYWTSKRGIGDPETYPEYWDDMGGPITEAGNTSFFNSTAVLSCIGTVGPEVQQFYEMEIRETPTGPLLLKPDIGMLRGYKGAFVGGDGIYTDRRGTVWSIGSFDSMVRSFSPRPYVA